MYNDLFVLLQQYIYGTSVLTEWQDLTLTIMSTCGCLFVVAIPFLIVWRVIRILCG